MEEGRVVVAIYLDFSRASHTTSSNIFMDKVVVHGVEKSTMRWIEK